MSEEKPTIVTHLVTALYIMDDKGRSNVDDNSKMLWNKDWDRLRMELIDALFLAGHITGGYMIHDDLQKLVDEQAEDDGLWFCAKTAPEAYLQQELRKLHAAIENRHQIVIECVPRPHRPPA